MHRDLFLKSYIIHYIRVQRNQVDSTEMWLIVPQILFSQWSFARTTQLTIPELVSRPKFFVCYSREWFLSKEKEMTSIKPNFSICCRVDDKRRYTKETSNYLSRGLRTRLSCLTDCGWSTGHDDPGRGRGFPKYHH